MELKKITKRVYYIPNSANIGVIKTGGKQVILIDSGLDDDTGKKILQLLEENHLFVKAIINTHSHADHCGGNRYIKEKTGAKIYAPELESVIIENPALEPFYLFSGANPINDLKNKFLMAQPSCVDYIIKRGGCVLKLDNIQLGVVQLHGHSPNQIGVEIDNILFCADSIFSEDILKKHKIPFYADIQKTKETLFFLNNSIYNFYIPSHAEPRKSLSTLVDDNLKLIESVEIFLNNNLTTKKTTEQVLKELCCHYKIELKGIQQYYLMNTISLAYLSFLYSKGGIKVHTKENYLFWSRS